MNRLHISMPAARCLALIVITLAVSASDNPCVAQFGSSSRSPTGGGPSPGRPGGPSASRPGYRSPVFEKRADGEVIRGVKFVGLQAASESEIRPELQTRIGRQFSPKMLQDDVRKLSSSGRFRNVRTYRKSVAGGVEVTFEVDELPTVGYIRFEGNKQVRDKKLRKRVDLKPGQPLHPYAIEESRRALQEYYLEQGFADAQVDIAEGTKPGDKGVVFSIYEGPQQRIFRTRFIGNTIVSDGRLRTIIESKPGLAWIFKGKVDKNQIEADREKLTAYYRSLGFFKARIGRTLDFSDSGKWLTLTFVIDEGPRYKIRNVSVIGNQAFDTDAILERLNLHGGDYFDSRRMNRDLTTLRDTYGSQGYIHADIQADPRFLEEPGTIDLVYDISEGEQYRVGKVLVNIEGDHPHTRRNVVINRLSLAPGDVVDIREIRASERRLRSSQLFLSDPASGVAPSIAIRPSETSGGGQLAEKPDGPGGVR